MKRGRLRVYLGAATGVGTTCAMLDEAVRRRDRGTRVLVGCVDAHSRPVTLDRLRQLMDPTLAPTELDVAAVLAARPGVVLVDELAHRNRDDGQRPHRWQDVDAILDAGIDVITTLTVQHIESLVDPVRDIVGRAPADLVPDDLLARADQIEVVDISPEAIRRRIAHGNVFGPDELQPVDADLFNSEAFAALRALMMFWMADRLVSAPDDPRGTREKVVVLVTDEPSNESVVRRAVRLAQRSRAPWIGLYVRRPDDNESATRELRRQRVESLGGTYQELAVTDTAIALKSFVETEGATQLVIGARRSGWVRRILRRRLLDEIIRSEPSADLHIVATDQPDRTDLPHAALGHVPVRRQLTSAIVGSLVLAALTAVLSANHGHPSVATSLSLYLLTVVGITALGGALPGLVAAVTAPLLAIWFVIPPYHTLRISDPENLLELLVFVSVASIVAAFVSIAARRAEEARRAQREASTLATLAASSDVEQPVTIVEQLRTTFHLSGASVLAVDASGTHVVAAAGDAPATADEADFTAQISATLSIAGRGAALTDDDHRVLRAFVSQLARAFEQQHLRSVAAEADALARADELRTAMLRAVSHDLRSPLASIKASVSSLRQPDVDWPSEVRDEFMESIESETDRLTAIVTNLLDMSRLEAGVLRPALRAVSLEEVVPAAVYSLGHSAEAVIVDMPPDLVDVHTDPALLERVVANLVANALKWSPPGQTVRVTAYRRDSVVQLHVVDHGPGIPIDQRSVVIQPFHRLDDSGTGSGLGLGLAIADRLVVAMGGSLDLRDSAGGGLTVVVTLPIEPTTLSEESR